jgi:cytohesin
MKHLLLTTIAAVVLLGCGTSIYEAAEEGQIEEVKKLLPADVNTKTKFMETPLHFAAENGQKEVAELLIDKGADVNANAKWERTPLHAAAKTGQKDIIELLIVADANVNAKDFENKTPLDEAIQLKRTETADLLRKHGGKTGEELKAEGN